MPEPRATDRLPRLAWLAAAALLVLAAGGFRHHLVWGESARWPWLLPLLNAAEAGSVVGFVALGGIAWWRGMQLAAAQQPSLRQLVRCTVPILVAAIVVPPFLSMDPIDYVVRGRVLALHGGNPYVQVASQFADDPFLAFGDAPWKDFPLPYGPIVANLQGAVAWLAHRFEFLPRPGELVVAIGLFKLLFAGCLLVAAVLARDVARHVRPGSEHRAFVALAWNPLLLNECVANAHNEPLLLVAVMAAVAALCSARAGAASFWLGVGVLTKFVPALLGPLFAVVAARQRRLGAFVLGVAACGVLAAVFWWQFFRVDGAFDFLRRQSQQNAVSLLWSVQRVFGIDDARHVLWPGRAAVLVVLGVAIVQAWRRPAPRVLLLGLAGVMLTLVACGLTLHGPWYHVWWVPFALLAGHGYLHRAACIASLSAPLGYLVWAFARRHDEPSQWLTLTMGMLLPLLGALVVRPRVSADA
ncbi:MAG: DUF2029 domain-containing protein [Planctomycetes bacterium]|nr:DUF2029 domain-containing protein [Planctomycetota bacterium]